MSHNMYYTKFAVPLGWNSKKTLYAQRPYSSDTRSYLVRKYEMDNRWWYSLDSGDLHLNSIAFVSARNMSVALRFDMHYLGFRPDSDSWFVVRKVGGRKNA